MGAVEPETKIGQGNDGLLMLAEIEGKSLGQFAFDDIRSPDVAERPIEITQGNAADHLGLAAFEFHSAFTLQREIAAVCALIVLIKTGEAVEKSNPTIFRMWL